MNLCTSSVNQQRDSLRKETSRKSSQAARENQGWRPETTGEVTKLQAEPRNDQNIHACALQRHAFQTKPQKEGREVRVPCGQILLSGLCD